LNRRRKRSGKISGTGSTTVRSNHAHDFHVRSLPAGNKRWIFSLCARLCQKKTMTTCGCGPSPTPPHHESVHACLPPARITAGTLDWCRSALHSATQLSDNLVRWPHHQPKMIVQVLLNDASQSLVVYENNARSSPSLSLLFSFLCFLEKIEKTKSTLYIIFLNVEITPPPIPYYLMVQQR
jgi:hypothetical protein